MDPLVDTPIEIFLHLHGYQDEFSDVPFELIHFDRNVTNTGKHANQKQGLQHSQYSSNSSLMELAKQVHVEDQVFLKINNK